MTPSQLASKLAFPYPSAPSDFSDRQEGLTFRELAAIHIHAALVTREWPAEGGAQRTVEHVDALIAALAKAP